MIAADDGFTKDILFWQKPAADTGAPLDADKEAKKIDQQRAGQAPGTPGNAAPPPKQEDKGWFDGWFDWF
jgi:hypothetical protein